MRALRSAGARPVGAEVALLIASLAANRGADLQLGNGRVAGGDLAVRNGGEALLVCPARVAGVVSLPGCLGCPGRRRRIR